jgi:hypothetical protein
MEEEAISYALRCPDGTHWLLEDVTHIFIICGGSIDLVEVVEQ